MEQQGPKLARIGTVITLRKADEIRSHGSLHSIARRKVPEDEPGSSKRYGLVGACGSGNQAGLVYLDPRFVPQQRTKLVAARSSEDDVESSDAASSFSKVFVVGRDSKNGVRMIATRSDSDATIAFTSPMEVSTFATRNDTANWTNVVELDGGATLCAGALLGGNAVARVTSSSLQVLTSESLEVLHETVISEGGIRHASLDAEQYVVLHTADNDTLIYRYDPSQRQFESDDVTSALNSAAPIVSANVFRDSFGHLDRAVRSSTASENGKAATNPAPVKQPISSFANDDDEEVDYGEDDDFAATAAAPANGNSTASSPQLSAVVEAGPAYLFTLDTDGVSRIFTLPDLRLIWQNASLAAQPQRLRYETKGHDELAPEQKAVISTAVACHIGDMLSIVSLTSDNFFGCLQEQRFGFCGRSSGTNSDR